MNNRPTLRALARRLGCSHSTLSEQIHRGDFSDGVRIENGRIVVVNLDVAAASYNGRSVVNPGLYAVIYDRNGYDWTGKSLLASNDAHDLLVRALIRSGLARGATRAAERAFVARVMARARAEAPLHSGYDQQTIDYVERVLSMVVAELQHPEELDDEDEQPEDEP